MKIIAEVDVDGMRFTMVENLDGSLKLMMHDRYTLTLLKSEWKSMYALLKHVLEGDETS